MNIGVTIGLGARGERTIDGLIARAQELEALGFHTVWMPVAFGFDAITTLAIIGRETAAIELGTAVVPTFPRHPVAMAQQALTAQAAANGRFTLGIGLSHKVMMEDALGIPYVQPARHMREYLAVLAPLLQGRPASFRGDLFRVETAVAVEGASAVPLLVAALGPAMLKLAGTSAGGTITSWVGPKTMKHHIVPSITAAAREAGNRAPRIVAGLPIALTDDPDGVRARIGEQAAWYETLPSYKAMFEREGVSGPADIAIVGDERALDAGLARLEEAGVTDFAAQFVAVGADVPARTLEYLAARVAAAV